MEGADHWMVALLSRTSMAATLSGVTGFVGPAGDKQYHMVDKMR